MSSDETNVYPIPDLWCETLNRFAEGDHQECALEHPIPPEEMPAVLHKWPVVSSMELKVSGEEQREGNSISTTRISFSRTHEAECRGFPRDDMEPWKTVKRIEGLSQHYMLDTICQNVNARTPGFMCLLEGNDGQTVVCVHRSHFILVTSGTCATKQYAVRMAVFACARKVFFATDDVRELLRNRAIWNRKVQFIVRGINGLVCCPSRSEFVLALVMCTHARLGEDSPLRSVLNNGDVLICIVHMIMSEAISGKDVEDFLLQRQ